MLLIFISGPSGCGKTTLSNQIIKKFKNGFVLSTDNYYKTGLLSKILSIFVHDYFDKYISFNYKLFKKDLYRIIKNGFSLEKRTYNFEKKTIKNYKNKINNIKFLIIEGIFTKEFSETFNNEKFYLLELKTNKNECMRRAIQRDFNERGKYKKQAEIDFLRSWDIYYERIKNSPKNKNSNEFIISENCNVEKVLKKIFNTNS